MTLLHYLINLYLWPITSNLAIVSIFTLLALFVFRSIRSRSENSKLQRVKEIKEILLIEMGRPLKDTSLLLKNKEDSIYLAETALDLLRNFKGKSIANLIVSLKKLDMDQWVYQSLIKGTVREKIIAVSLSHHFHCGKIKNALLKLLKTNHMSLHYEIIKSLTKANDYFLLTTILNEIQKKISNYSTPIIANILTQYDNDIVEFASPLLKSETLDNKIKGAIVQAIIEKSSIERIASYVQNYCSLEDKFLKKAGFNALSSLHLPPVEALEKGLQDPDWHIRAQIPKAAIKLNPFPYNIFYKLLADENWHVGLETAKVLIQLEPAGVKLLIALSRDCSHDSSRIDGILAEVLSQNET